MQDQENLSEIKIQDQKIMEDDENENHVDAEMPRASHLGDDLFQFPVRGSDAIKAESVSLVWAIREAECGDWEILTSAPRRLSPFCYR